MEYIECTDKEIFLTLLQLLKRNDLRDIKFGPENYFWIRDSDDWNMNTYICLYDGHDIYRYKSYVGHDTITNSAVEYLIASTDDDQYASDDSTSVETITEYIGDILNSTDTSGKLWMDFLSVYKDLFESKSQSILERV